MKEAEQWERVRARLNAELGDKVFSSWFSRMELENLNDTVVSLSVPTRFLKQWVQNHYLAKILSIWQENVESIKRVDIYVRGASRAKISKQSSERVDAENSSSDFDSVGGAFADPSHSNELGGSPLDPKHSFSSFVSGKANHLAHAAAMQVANRRAGEPVRYNPLFIHSSVGLGKTHLLQAIARQAGSGKYGRRVAYFTAERFLHRFVASLQDKTAIDFKDKLRGIDILLIDDLQFLTGRVAQQECCHILDALVDSSRQVVVAADRPHSELENIDARFKSRLAAGFSVEIGAPDFDLRRDILKSRTALAQQSYPDFKVPDCVIDYVANMIVTDGRDLDGAINRLIAPNQLTGTPVTVELAELALKDLVRARDTRPIRIEDIQRIVAEHYNVTRNELLSVRRTRAIVRPRQVAMFLAKTLTPRSLPEIGRRFGDRDHTTVLHAVRKIEKLEREDERLADEIDALRRKIDQ